MLEESRLHELDFEDWECSRSSVFFHASTPRVTEMNLIEIWCGISTASKIFWFLLVQIVHKMIASYSLISVSREDRRWNNNALMPSTAWNWCWIMFHDPAFFHIVTAWTQPKNKCQSFPKLVSQKGHSWGQWTPLDCNWVLNGKHPLKILQRKCFILGGIFSFHNCIHSSSSLRWLVSMIEFTRQWYAVLAE